MLVAYLRQFVTAVIIAIIFSEELVKLLEPDALPVFIVLLPTIVLLWIGFTAMPALSGVIWEKKPMKLYAIHVGYELVSLLVMTLVITTWF